MAVCVQCQVPLTLAGTVCSIWGAVWQHGHLCTAGVHVPLPGRDNTQLCHPTRITRSTALWPCLHLDKHGKGSFRRAKTLLKKVMYCKPKQFVIYISDWFYTYRTLRFYSQSSKTESWHFWGYDRIYFSPVIFCSGSSLRVVALVYKQLSSSVLLCSCLCPRWGSVMQAGGDEKEDSNLSEKGSSLLLSCRLAYCNRSQAFTPTEDGLSVCVCEY